MSGKVAGLYKQNNKLFFRQPSPDEPDMVPLSGDECVAVYAAMKAAHDENLKNMNETGKIDLDGFNQRVKQAGQDALVDYIVKHA